MVSGRLPARPGLPIQLQSAGASGHLKCARAADARFGRASICWRSKLEFPPTISSKRSLGALDRFSEAPCRHNVYQLCQSLDLIRCGLVAGVAAARGKGLGDPPTKADEKPWEVGKHDCDWRGIRVYGGEPDGGTHNGYFPFKLLVQAVPFDAVDIEGLFHSGDHLLDGRMQRLKAFRVSDAAVRLVRRILRFPLIVRPLKSTLTGWVVVSCPASLAAETSPMAEHALYRRRCE